MVLVASRISEVCTLEKASMEPEKVPLKEDHDL